MQMADLVPSDNGKNGFCVVEWKNPQVTGSAVGPLVKRQLRGAWMNFSVIKGKSLAPLAQSKD